MFYVTQTKKFLAITVTVTKQINTKEQNKYIMKHTHVLYNENLINNSNVCEKIVTLILNIFDVQQTFKQHNQEVPYIDKIKFMISIMLNQIINKIKSQNTPQFKYNSRHKINQNITTCLSLACGNSNQITAYHT